MKSPFGFFAELEIIQNFASKLISNINPAAHHNIEKYYALKKIFHLCALDDTEGDYLEFGVYKGSSFSHAMRCCRALAKLNPNLLKTNFYGFDSFEGFGKLSKDDKNFFFKDDNFKTSFKLVSKRIKSVAGNSLNFKLVKGFFSESLKNGPAQLGIKKSKIIFIDSDTYESSKDALKFSSSTLQEGSFIILDDFFSYKGSKLKGVKKAFDELITESKIEVRLVLNYGSGGSIFIVSKITKK